MKKEQRVTVNDFVSCDSDEIVIKGKMGNKVD